MFKKETNFNWKRNIHAHEKWFERLRQGKNNVKTIINIYLYRKQKKNCFAFWQKELCYGVGDIDDVSDNDRHIYKKIGEKEEMMNRKLRNVNKKDNARK